MKRIVAAAICLLCIPLLTANLTHASGDTLILNIDVAPSVLNLQNNGTVVTVHTDIGYSLVLASQVYLNDIPIQSYKADNRGYFVAKFDINEVKALIGLKIGEYNRLTLTGVTVNGDSFIGSEDVLVINIIPKK